MIFGCEGIKWKGFDSIGWRANDNRLSPTDRDTGQWICDEYRRDKELTLFESGSSTSRLFSEPSLQKKKKKKKRPGPWAKTTAPGKT